MGMQPRGISSAEHSFSALISPHTPGGGDSPDSGSGREGPPANPVIPLSITFNICIVTSPVDDYTSI